MLEKFYSLQALVKAGRQKVIHKKTVTFDLFDTLLVRRIHDPDLVKLPVARFIAERAKQDGIRIGFKKVQRIRDEAEKENRARTAESHEDHEACYPLFMRQALRTIWQEKFAESLFEEVAAYEIAMENSMLVPRKELFDWLVELSDAGKRIFIISDMYLPASYLEQLLEYAGIRQYVEEVISSADSYKAKASGLGYALVAERFGLDREEWLHIGDNEYSDGLRAEEFGIDSLIIHDPKEDQRKSIVKRYFNYSDGKPFWRGRVLQQLMAPLEGENTKKEPLYIEGYNFIGPVIGIFVMRLAELCREKKITKIFFLSREGWTFKRYWEQAMPRLYPAGELPETEYLYVSRMALAGASCAVQGLTETNFSIAFLPSGNRDFTDVCRIFGLDADKFTELLAEYKLSKETCLSPVHEGYEQENRKSFETLLEDVRFQDEVRRQVRDSSEALQRYLEDVGFFDHERVAVVDIGWLGSIQRFLFEAVAHREDAPVCHGYLFGATRGIPYPTSEKNLVTGLIYDRDCFDLAASTLYYARDVFEEACRAPYPTLNSYVLKDDGYDLVFRTTDDEIGQGELKQDEYFKPLQQGIYDSAARFGAAAALLGYPAFDYKPWINYLLVNKLAFPKAEEVYRLRNHYHLDDFHGKKKPKKDFQKGIIELWDRSKIRLSWDPFVRLKHFIGHLRARINE